MKYQEVKDFNDETGKRELVDIIKGTADDGTVWWIPKAKDNSHYSAYLKWVEEGNTPEPADE
tara:strand:+ start:266 stop:451 length:186 start_codon:yes stop_codon:yes gene_type:complete